MSTEKKLREALVLAETYVQTAFSRATNKMPEGQKLPQDHQISVDLATVHAALLAPEGPPPKLPPADLIIDTYTQSNSGGFSTYNPGAVRIIHRPSGLSAECSSERSQFANKERAMQELASLVAEHSSNARQEPVAYAVDIRGKGQRTTVYTEVLPFTPEPGYEVIGEPRALIYAESPPLPVMRYETFQNSRGTEVEWGFAFYLGDDDTDGEFHLILGEVDAVRLRLLPKQEQTEKIQASFAKHEWAAKAIVEAFNRLPVKP